MNDADKKETTDNQLPPPPAEIPAEATEAAPTAENPQEAAKPSSPSMEERMLEMLLREKHYEALDKALAEGKTVHGAWNYVVSVMKNAYISEHGRVNGGCCGNPDVVVGIAERYLREFPEGYVEPEVSHTPKKSPQKPDAKSAAKKVVNTAKSAAKSAKAEAKRKANETRKAWANKQMTLF